MRAPRPTVRSAVRSVPTTGVILRRYHQPERDGRGFFLLAESKKGRLTAPRIRRAGEVCQNSGRWKENQGKMSVTNSTSLSPGPGARRKRRRRACCFVEEGILTEVLARTCEKGPADATQHYRPVGVHECAVLCFHQHSRFVRQFSLNPLVVGVGFA